MRNKLILTSILLINGCYRDANSNVNIVSNTRHGNVTDNQMKLAKQKKEIAIFNEEDLYKKYFPYGKNFMGDFYSKRFLGYSYDGRYIAFEEMGFADFITGGVEIFIIDTDKNSWVGKPHFIPYEIITNVAKFTKKTRPKEIIENESLAIKKIIESYGISGDLYGEHVVNQSVHYMALDNYLSKSQFDMLSSFSISNKTYKVSIKTEKSLNQKSCPYGNQKKLEVTLENNKGNIVILQRDSKIPKWRECADYFRIEDVYVYNDRVAVFLKVFIPGWEGGLIKNMVVTGKLN
jgi:predicted secreted protein